jgi:hypothetical protein
MTTRPTRFAALLLTAALAFGACSDEAAENPEQAFSDALDTLAGYEGVTLVMTIEADPDDLAATDTPPDVAEKVLNSSLTISTKGSTPEDTQAAFVFNVDGNEDAAELRVVDQALYARVDVRELVDDFGGDITEIEAGADAAAAQGLDFAQAAVDGEWLGLEGLDEAVEQLAGELPTPDPEQAEEVGERVIGILERNARVTSEGTDDVGAHLVVSVPARDTVQDLFDALQSLGGVPLDAFPTDDLQDIPDGDIPIDVWIDDDRLVQLELDLVRIAREFGDEPPEGVEQIALRMTIDEFTDDIEPPDDFVSIDLQEILGGLFGAMPATPEVSEPEAVPLEPGGVLEDLGIACSDLQGVPPDQIKAFLDASLQPDAFATVKRECPELFE